MTSWEEIKLGIGKLSALWRGYLKRRGRKWEQKETQSKRKAHHRGSDELNLKKKDLQHRSFPKSKLRGMVRLSFQRFSVGLMGLEHRLYMRCVQVRPG